MTRVTIYSILGIVLILTLSNVYKSWGSQGIFHQNVYTGAVCYVNEQCWLK